MSTCERGRSWIRTIAMRAVFREDVEQGLVGQFLPKSGFFVEVGAFDPVELSQTFHLEQRGWDGLLIEPVPAHVEKLKAKRRAMVVPVACGSPNQHGQAMPIYVAGGRSSLRYAHGPAINVPIMTLDAVLSASGVTNIDFLSVDVEGAELDVLSGLSFDRYRPDLVLLEDFADDLSRDRFMRARNYKRVRRTGNNSWYVPTEIDFPISLFGRFQLLRKYYLSLPVRRIKSITRCK